MCVVPYSWVQEWDGICTWGNGMENPKNNHQPPSEPHFPANSWHLLLLENLDHYLEGWKKIRIWKNTSNFNWKIPCPKIWFPQKHHQKNGEWTIILEAMKVIHIYHICFPLKNDAWNTGFLLGWQNFTYVKLPGATLSTYFNKIKLVSIETYTSCTCLWDFLPTNLWGSGIFRRHHHHHHHHHQRLHIQIHFHIDIHIHQPSSIIVCHTIINHLIHLATVRVETEKSHQSVHKIPIYKCQGFSGCVHTT